VAGQPFLDGLADQFGTRGVFLQGSQDKSLVKVRGQGNGSAFSPLHGERTAKPIDEALESGKILRLYHTSPAQWLVRAEWEKRWLTGQGVPGANVWTLRELKSVPWDGPLTLETVAKAFGPGLDGV
jgi:hypothetical protein